MKAKCWVLRRSRYPQLQSLSIRKGSKSRSQGPRTRLNEGFWLTTGLAIPELSNSVPELLLYHYTVPDQTLKPTFSKISYLHLYIPLHLYLSIYLFSIHSSPISIHVKQPELRRGTSRRGRFPGAVGPWTSLPPCGHSPRPQLMYVYICMYVYIYKYIYSHPEDRIWTMNLKGFRLLIRQV